ncbi:TolC family protein [Natranaerobius thermophilus]|uniref:Outer membrane protein-like protein n=1 Tax=Natranaerobius thermophilus (strain ATCC BAA-1301 / DSM 18059 / JW/NM-WN-LF) TaxID=457570 RepID=B2A6H7_NATTJ|nr:TolC family protein [Natranaerobius thermophilus]ACB85510.1 Outer membrane protein-like protein [Natranaerobius thermophilus JW/NM-WN-LF]
MRRFKQIASVMITVVLVFNPILSFFSNNEKVLEASEETNVQEENVKELDITKARELALENSPEAQKIRIQLKQLVVGVDMAEDRHNQLEDLQDDIKNLEDTLLDIDPDFDEAEEIFKNMMIEIFSQIDEIDIEDSEAPFPNGNEFNEIDFEYEDEIKDAVSELFAHIEDGWNNYLDDVEQAFDDVDYEDGLDDLILEVEQKKRELEQQKDLAELKWQQGQEKIMFQAEALYTGLLMMEEALDYMDEAMELMYEQVGEIKAKREVGESVDLELDAAKLEKEQLKQEQQSLENQYRDLKRQFSRLLGQPLNTEYHLEPIHAEMEDYDINELIDKLLGHGKEIEIAEQELEFAKDNLEWMEDNHGKNSLECEMAELELQMSELNYNDTRVSMEKVMRNVYDEYKETKSQYNLSEDALQVQEDFFEGILIQEELGMVSDLETLEGEIETEEVKMMNNLSDLQLFLAERQLELVSEGFLTENILDQINLDEDSLEGNGFRNDMNDNDPAQNDGLNNNGFDSNGDGFRKN